MQATYTSTIGHEQAIFSLLQPPSFAARLGGALKEGAREFAESPLGYLRLAFFPERTADWLPLRLASAIGSFVAHPFKGLGGLLRRDRIPVGFINSSAAHSASFVTNALSPAKATPRAWDRFVPVLVGSGALHGVLIGVLGYLTIINMLRPYTDVRVVNKPYRPYSSEVIRELYARSRPVAQPTDKVLSLDELRERERKLREERERHRAEEEARLKAEREKAEREAKEAEEKAKAEAAAKAAADKGPMKFGEINETAIKDLIKKMFESYKTGGLDAGNYSVMIGFKIDCDGSMPRSSIHVVSSDPPNPKKEDIAKQILWLIGESHALGPLCQFSANTIAFEMNDSTTRLTISGFGPTPEWTSEKSTQLRTLFGALGFLKGNTVTGELAKLVKIHPVGKRLDLDLTVSRARASEMMREGFGGNPQ